ncbi:hypothetical protein NG895_18485 [Aeoliella sp. ICT_H6.2]|uniref:Lipoprotein n=1 Tax=Aeoliella straminimaris TaxID=2954799 RepID=A0A9X2FD40_9BACT|nr:hypothetical protein [Aeoliella straminimaris]MCO6045892.1 hypothetical protein [Aeoliella straminimaris]
MFHQRIVRLSLTVCLLAACGCSSWRTPNLNGLRDPRAVDIDSRLAGPANDNLKAE